MEKTFFILPPSISLTPPRDEPDLHMAFEISDDSMSDGTRYSYEPGDMVICRRLPRRQWWTQIHTACYDLVLVHRTSGALLRKISYHDPIDGVLTLHSLNPLYHDFTLDIADISHIYSVIKVERTK
jgi:hypothetical protein